MAVGAALLLGPTLLLPVTAVLAEPAVEEPPALREPESAPATSAPPVVPSTSPTPDEPAPSPDAGVRGSAAADDAADGAAEEEPIDDGFEDWLFENPFADVYDEGPGLLRIAFQVGSYHRDGLGPALTLVPWEYLHITASYGYRTDHSVAGLLAVPILPRALLSPYVTAGYALAIASLPQGIRLDSHQFVAGLGLEARLFDRYVLGAEMTGNGIVVQTLKNKSTSIDLSPGERFTVQPGFHLGVHLP